MIQLDNNSNLSFLLPDNYNPATDTIQLVDGKLMHYHVMTPEELQPWVWAVTVIICVISFYVGLRLSRTKHGQKLKAMIARRENE